MTRASRKNKLNDIIVEFRQESITGTLNDQTLLVLFDAACQAGEVSPQDIFSGLEWEGVLSSVREEISQWEKKDNDMIGVPCPEISKTVKDPLLNKLVSQYT